MIIVCTEGLHALFEDSDDSDWDNNNPDFALGLNQEPGEGPSGGNPDKAVEAAKTMSERCMHCARPLELSAEEKSARLMEWGTGNVSSIYLLWELELIIQTLTAGRLHVQVQGVSIPIRWARCVLCTTACLPLSFVKLSGVVATEPIQPGDRCCDNSYPMYDHAGWQAGQHFSLNGGDPRANTQPGNPCWRCAFCPERASCSYIHTSPPDSFNQQVPTFTSLMTFLLAELVHADSFHAPWLATLPGLQELQNAPYMDPEEVAAITEEALAMSVKSVRERSLAAQSYFHRNLQTAFPKAFPGDTESEDSDSIPPFGAVMQQWASAVVLSRAFEVHGHMVILPLIDAFNHDPKRGGDLRWNASGEFEVVAGDAYEPGEEVFLCYGPPEKMGNDNLKATYGFTIP